MNIGFNNIKPLTKPVLVKLCRIEADWKKKMMGREKLETASHFLISLLSVLSGTFPPLRWSCIIK